MIHTIFNMITGNDILGATTLRNASIDQKRSLMLKALSQGKIASITYTDAKGVVQERQAKLWIERHLTSGDRNIVGVNVPASLD